MTTDFNHLGRLRVQRRMTELFHEYMPDRYVVDDDGWADWMNKPVEILMEEFGNIIAVDALHALTTGEVA